MARYLQSTCSEDKLEQVGQEEILDRQLLFEKDNKILYIKFNGELIPIGGACKQDLFQAGDNIEIVDLEAKEVTDPLQEVRLKDNIDINSMKLTPEGEGVNWLGTYELGSLNDGNLVLLLTPETSLDESKGFIGGEVFIEMKRVDGIISYAHYELTSTSTGSWSLQGACEDQAEVRMVKAKWQGQYYYGLKLPKSSFSYTITEIKTRWVTKTRKELVTKVIPDQKNTLYLQVGLPQKEDLTLTDSTSNEVSSFGTQRFSVTGKGLPNASLELLGPTQPDGSQWFTIPLKNLVPEIEYEHNETWKKWIDNEYYLSLQINSKNIPKGTIDINYTGVDQALDLHKTNSVIFRGVALSNTNMDLELYNYTTNSFQSIQDYYKGRDGQYYGFFYEIPLTVWETFMDFKFQGEVAQYRDQGAYFRLRMYYRTTNNSYDFGLTYFDVRNTEGAQIPIEGYLDYFDFAGMSHYQRPIYVGTEANLGNSQNFILKEGIVDSSENRLKIQIPELRITESKPTTIPTRETSEVYFYPDESGTLKSSVEGIDAFRFFDSNFTIPEGTSNPNPFLGTNGFAYLRYGTEAVNPAESWSILTETKDDYYYDVIEDVEYQEEEEYEDIKEVKVASAIQSSKFWFNGWKTCELPTGYTDSDLTFQVLSDKSNDNDSYAGSYYYGSLEDYLDTSIGIQALPDTGEDNAPYKIIINQEYLSIQDLKSITSYIKHLERQIYLDLSQCKVLPDAETWEPNLFEGCASLRGLAIPQGVKGLEQGIFKWCTYMRTLDLTPSSGTLKRLGSTNWEQNSGFLVSTRVTTLLVPKSVNKLQHYLVTASNIKNFICLHDSSIKMEVSGDYQSEDSLSATMWTWVGKNDMLLPEGFHIFFSKSFWEANPNKNWDWNNSGGWWTTNLVQSVVIYPENGTQTEWQDFNDQYHWGEDLINEVRAQFGQTDRITILN